MKSKLEVRGRNVLAYETINLGNPDDVAELQGALTLARLGINAKRIVVEPSECHRIRQVFRSGGFIRLW